MGVRGIVWPCCQQNRGGGITRVEEFHVMRLEQVHRKAQRAEESKKLIRAEVGDLSVSCEDRMSHCDANVTYLSIYMLCITYAIQVGHHYLLPF
jgi:hypothetical protein